MPVPISCQYAIFNDSFSASIDPSLDGHAQDSFKVARLQIPRHAGQLDDQAVELLGHLDLAAESRGLGQAKGEVEHVVFVVVGLLHGLVLCLVVDDDVAGRAGAGAAAGAFHLEVVGLGDVEQVVALADLEGVGLVVLVDECDVQPVRRSVGSKLCVCVCM